MILLTYCCSNSHRLPWQHGYQHLKTFWEYCFLRCLCFLVKQYSEKRSGVECRVFLFVLLLLFVCFVFYPKGTSLLSLLIDYGFKDELLFFTESHRARDSVLCLSRSRSVLLSTRDFVFKTYSKYLGFWLTCIAMLILAI